MSVKIADINRDEKFINPASNIIGGFILMVLSTFFLLLTLNLWVGGMNALLISLMRYAGILGVFEGFYTFLRGMIGNSHVKRHQLIIIVQVLTSLSGVLILLTLYNGKVYSSSNAWKGKSF